MVTVMLFVGLLICGMVPLVGGLLTTAPTLECLDDALRLHFVPETRPFLGHVYVKGFFYSSRCHLDYTQYSMAEPFFFHIPYRSDCQIRRERLNDPRGVSYTVTVVVQHHRLFVTSIDKAYSVSCFYRDTQTKLENAVQIGDLTTQVITQSDGNPACAYDVLQGTIDGPVAKYANIGDTLVHRFSCDSPNMGILVHSCYVRDGVGNEFALLDERGCSTDTSLVVPITYTDDLSTAFAPISAFKFADQMIIYFTCQITLCNADNNGCEGITPPQCTPTPLPGQPGGPSMPVTSTNENGSYGNFEDSFPESENTGALPVRPPTRNYTSTPLPPIYSTTEEAATTTTTTTTARPTTSTSTTTTTTTTRAPTTTTTPYLIPPPTTTQPFQPRPVTTPGYPPSVPPYVAPRPTTPPPGNAYGYGGSESNSYGQQGGYVTPPPPGFVNNGNSGNYNQGPSTPYETGATTAGANIFNRGWGQTGATASPGSQIPVEPIPQPLMPNMFRNEFASARHARDLPQNHPDTITLGVTADQLIVFTREDKDVPEEIKLDDARKAAENNETEASEDGGESADASVGEISAACGRSMAEFFWIAAFFVSLIGFGIVLFVQRHHYEQKLKKQPKSSFKAHPQIVTLSYP
uniref:ZP domain-containing protein n=1 Tax=Panagrellus redivivus TaxID=6233 RepID=A0A7E4VHH4_PANRE